ncbi:MAG: hypothetical protein EU531_08775 [Promethearchaeota archaeon]|nr:MAG: hypothetical protein EU531_08775 [Candidatus Lokiarchaeota archaeon]
MVRYYLLVLKIINVLVFIWIITIFLNLFHFDEVLYTESGELALSAFINSVRNIFTYAIFGLAMIVAFGSAVISSIMFFNVRFEFMQNFIEIFFRNYIGLWFHFPTGNPPELTQIPTLIIDEFFVFLEDLYLVAFILLFIISIVFLIRSFIKTNPKHDLIAVGALVTMLILPLIISGLKDMLNLLYIEIEYLEDLANPLDPSLSQIPIDNLFLFLASPTISLAIISYIYLEIAFQINYTDTVTKPSLQRSVRLEVQLSILKSESQYVTANVEKIKEEAQKRREQLKIEEKPTISKFFSKTGESFSYVKEMIERKKLEEEEKKLVTAASKTRRLGRYVERLFREDPEAQDTLTARNSAPKQQSLVLSTLTNFIFRVTLLVIVSFIIIHPKWFLETAFDMPPAIVESVVMFSPEVIIILLLPIMLIFPVIAKIISYIKHRNLIIKLQQEGRIKEILASVGDYVKKDVAEPPTIEEITEV